MEEFNVKASRSQLLLMALYAAHEAELDGRRSCDLDDVSVAESDILRHLVEIHELEEVERTGGMWVPAFDGHLLEPAA